MTGPASSRRPAAATGSCETNSTSSWECPGAESPTCNSLQASAQESRLRPRPPLSTQCVVLTGASSGIGRCTARMLAALGARIVVTSRRADALESLVRDIEWGGGQAIAVPGDVSREGDLRLVARAAVNRFGGIDTWVNNAGVYLQAPVEATTLDEYRRLLEVNFLGYVAGTQCALEVMRPRGAGGIICVSSIVARRAAAYNSAYAASKAAVDAFVQALRTELWGSDISVSTLYLPAVDTPVYRHARAKFGTVPKPPPPVQDPSWAARAIARLCERPRPERVAGGFGPFYSALARLPAGAADWFLHHTSGFTVSDIPADGDNLDRPLADVPRERDGWAERGWRGWTIRETARVLPIEFAVGAALSVAATVSLARRL
ncbi:MAG TPA: SDR family oxidoreductase, partial [Gemmatimonadales bacterium]|nr:SDR family oxidoreductase [Gemmatimonadales bacterium]